MRKLLIIFFTLSAYLSSADSLPVRKWKATGVDFYIYKEMEGWNNLNLEKIARITNNSLNPSDSDFRHLRADSLGKGKYRPSPSGFSLAFILSSTSGLKFFNTRELRIGLEFFELMNSYDDWYAVATAYQRTDFGDSGHFESMSYIGVATTSLSMYVDYLQNKTIGRDFAIYTGARLSGSLVQSVNINFEYRKAFEMHSPSFTRDYIDYTYGDRKVSSPFSFAIGIPLGIKYNLNCHFNLFAEYAALLRGTVIRSADDVLVYYHSGHLGLRYKFGRLGNDEEFEKEEGAFW